MPLIHLLNEVVTQRQLGPQSWATYISYSMNDSTGAIIAESFSVYHNSNRTCESYRWRVGAQRVSYNKAPSSVTQQLRLLSDVAPHQPRDTISFEDLANIHRTANPASPAPVALPA